MKLADFATADCLGLVLAHRQTSGSGNLKKGTILTGSDGGAIAKRWRYITDLRQA
jgi:hypothetical protein